VPTGTPPLPPLEPRHGPIVLNPRGRAPDFTLKEDRYVSIDDVKKALDEKRRLIITDARAPSDYASLHITGAISTPYYALNSLDDLPNDGTWVLAYCACPHHVSGEVVDELRKRGYKHTAVIDEGIFAWQHKRYPVVAAPGLPPSPAPPPLPARMPLRPVGPGSWGGPKPPPPPPRMPSGTKQ
jgi:cytochrome c oxidase cbb3-type subunit 3